MSTVLHPLLTKLSRAEDILLVEEYMYTMLDFVCASRLRQTAAERIDYELPSA